MIKFRVMRRAAFPQEATRPETAIVLVRIPERREYAVFTEADQALRNGYYSRDLERCVAEYELRKRVTAGPGETPVENFYRSVK